MVTLHQIPWLLQTYLISSLLMFLTKNIPRSNKSPMDFMGDKIGNSFFHSIFRFPLKYLKLIFFSLEIKPLQAALCLRFLASTFFCLVSSLGAGKV